MPTFHGNWWSKKEKTVREYKNIKFYRVINPGDFIPDQLGIQHTNLKHLTYEEFGNRYPDCVVSTENVQKTTV